MTEKNDSKWASLATAPILGQPPRAACNKRTSTLCTASGEQGTQNDTPFSAFPKVR